MRNSTRKRKRFENESNCGENSYLRPESMIRRFTEMEIKEVLFPEVGVCDPQRAKENSDGLSE